MSRGMSEQLEARWCDRQSQFEAALMGGQPLYPDRRYGWTLGDLVMLCASTRNLINSLKGAQIGEPELEVPLSEIFEEAA